MFAHIFVKSFLCLGFIFSIHEKAMAAEPGQIHEVEILEDEQDSDSSALIPDSWMKDIEDFVAKLEYDIKIGADWGGKDVNAAIFYARGIEPSYKRGYTSIIDDYNFNLALRPLRFKGDDENSFRFNLGADARARLSFIRQMQGTTVGDKARATVAIPYTPWKNLPSTADRALDRLAIGDFVALKTNLNLILSAGQYFPISSGSGVKVSGYYVVGGEFLIHLFRISEEKFRIKLIRVRSENKGLAASLGFDPDEYGWDVFGIDYVDKWIRRRFRVSVASVALGFPKDNVVMVDYVLNLRDPEVANAYNELLRSVFSLKKLKISNPLESETERRTAMLADVSVFEELYERNKNKSVQRRTVDRMFRGANDTENGSKVRIALGQRDIAQITFDSQKVDNRISAIDRNGIERHFYMPTYSKTKEGRLLLGIRYEETFNASSLLFETNKNKDITSFGELTFYQEHKDANFTPSEVRSFQNHIRKRLPSSIYSQIDWGDWSKAAQGRSDKTSARVTSLLVLRASALKGGEKLTEQDIRTQLLEYLKSLPELEADFSQSPHPDERKYRTGSLEDDYKIDLDLISNHLRSLVQPSTPGWKRAQAFRALSSNDLFEEIGPGFLVHLLGEGNISDQIYFETTWTAKDMDTLDFRYGECRYRRIYKAVHYIYSVINNRNLDVRLIDESEVPDLPDDKGAAPGCGD